MAATRMQRRKRWLVRVAVVIVLGGAAFGVRRGLPLPPPPGAGGGALPSGVEVAKVERGTQQRKISATGVVASQTGTQVKIGSQVTGRIRELPADVGTVVKAGKVVALLDAPDLEAQVEQQRRGLAMSEASLAQAKARFRQAAETAGYTAEQTTAQIAEAGAAIKAAQARVESSAAAARLQPAQTSSEVQRARAALSTARSAQKQVEQTVRQQIQQTQASVDEAQATADNAKLTLSRKQQLLKDGFIAGQEVDDAEASHRQAVARLANAKAGLDITQEKTRADLQSAEDQVKQAQANLDAAEAGRFQDAGRDADLRSSRETLRQAEATLDLRQASRRGDRVKQMAVEEARAAVRQAEAGVLQATAQLNYQLAQQDKTVIRSPISGTVLSITAQQGETVAAGLAAPTLITVADLNRLEIRAYVDETDIQSVKAGMPAEVRVDAFAGRVFRGKVTKIASASTVKDNVVTYETTVAVENAGGLMRPDMTADVSLILGEKRDLLLVPSEAVHREVARSLVYVLHPDRQGADRVESRPVEVGFDDGTHMEIRSGVREGEQVVLAGLPRLGVRAPDSQRGGPGQ